MISASVVAISGINLLKHFMALEPEHMTSAREHQLFWMIMIHLVNHSSYHRAQIAMLLRQNGFEPVNTDFITYDRVITGQMKE